jgi:site-specific DNA-methyltransferase (adenine-specific)
MIKLYNNDILRVNFDCNKSNLIVTSPPYNVGIEYDNHKDTMTYDGYIRWCKKWLQKIYNHTADEGRICINVPLSITTRPEHLESKEEVGNTISYSMLSDFTQMLKESGFKYWRTVIWEKNKSDKTCWGSWRSASAPFMRDPSEGILIGYKGNWKRSEEGESTITGHEFIECTKNVWKINPEIQSDHPAAFPIDLPEKCIKLLSYKNDWIMDPFMGSGSTGEAAVRLGRNFIGVELSPDYFNSAKGRIEDAEFQTKTRNEFFPDQTTEEEYF